MKAENSIIQVIKDWWRYLPNHPKLGDMPKPNAYDIEVASSGSNIANFAIWTTRDTIDIVEDILGWINTNLEDLLHERTVEVNVIIGDTLKNFIEECQHNNQYTEIPYHILTCLNNSVVLVVMDEYGNITGVQMIRSNEGLSEESKTQFDEQQILKVKIPT